MNVTRAIQSRRSVRAFLDQPVDKDTLTNVLEQAQRAPSGGNTQPWNAVVVTGDALAEITAAIKAKAAQAPMGEDMEYAIYPQGLDDRYEAQRRAVGEAMYQGLGIPKEDKMARIQWLTNNWESFGAPVQLFTYTKKYMGPPQWSDMGMWLQNVMLLLREAGLDSCAQEIWALYGTYMREVLGIDDSYIFFCGMAIGYRNPEASVNNFEVPRIPIDQAIRWDGWE